MVKPPARPVGIPPVTSGRSRQVLEEAALCLEVHTAEVHGLPGLLFLFWLTTAIVEVREEAPVVIARTSRAEHPLEHAQSHDRIRCQLGHVYPVQLKDITHRRRTRKTKARVQKSHEQNRLILPRARHNLRPGGTDVVQAP